jgi:hypothetical protein
VAQGASVFFQCCTIQQILAYERCVDQLRENLTVGQLTPNEQLLPHRQFHNIWLGLVFLGWLPVAILWTLNNVRRLRWRFSAQRRVHRAAICSDDAHRQAAYPGYEDWQPRFWNYVFLAYTTSAAYSPTDTLPLSRVAKLLNMAQSISAFIAITAVAGTASNILAGSA